MLPPAFLLLVAAGFLTFAAVPIYRGKIKYRYLQRETGMRTEPAVFWSGVGPAALVGLFLLWQAVSETIRAFTR